MNTVLNDQRTIRVTERADLEQIRSLVAATGVFTEDEVAIAMELVDIYLNDPGQEDYELFSCVDGEKVLGYICVGPTPATDATYDLYWIAVDPTDQGRGVGSQLLASTEEHLKTQGCGLLIAETSSTPKYDRTRLFYEKKGFLRLAQIKDYYRAGDDLVIYGKYL